MKIFKQLEHLSKAILGRYFEPHRKRCTWQKNILSEYNIRKILFIRNDRIGDLVVSEPVFRNLKKCHPAVQIDVLLGKSNFAARNGVVRNIDKFYCYNKKFHADRVLLKHLRKEKYDLVVDLMDNKSTTSAIIIKMIKARFAAGYDKENGQIYNFVVPQLNKSDYHIVERTGSILHLFGISNPDLVPQWNISDSAADRAISNKAGRPLLGINLSGSNASKYWGEDNYRDFIIKFTKEISNVGVVLLYTKDYEAIAKRIADSTGVQLGGLFPNFDDYAAYIAGLDFLLTPDTAAVHLASVFRKKCIVLYNQNLDDKNSLKPWFPYNVDYRAFGTKSGNLSEISPKAVLEAAKTLFEQ